MNLNRLSILTRVGSRLMLSGRTARLQTTAAVNKLASINYGKKSMSANQEYFRFFSDAPKHKFEPSRIEPRLKATYDEIVALPKNPQVLLIDVRQPSELSSTGSIPSSINIPLKNVAEELKLSPEQFQRKYGRPKPAKDSPIIFCCRIGVRSGEAANVADQLGFTNVKNYVGSWMEYAAKNDLPQ